MSMAKRSCSQFSVEKARTLGQLDLSRKGCVDEAIVSLVEYINARDQYYTTSSCSGRIIVFSEVYYYHIWVVLNTPLLYRTANKQRKVAIGY